MDGSPEPKVLDDLRRRLKRFQGLFEADTPFPLPGQTARRKCEQLCSQIRRAPKLQMPGHVGPRKRVRKPLGLNLLDANNDGFLR